jgi:hypothetical protein
MHVLIKSATVMTSLALSCSAAFAAGSLQAKVVKVDGDQVTLAFTEKAPAWLAQGDSVNALGWEVPVSAVQGQQVVLTVDPAKTAKLKVASQLLVQEVNNQDRFSC